MLIRAAIAAATTITLQSSTTSLSAGASLSSDTAAVNNKMSNSGRGSIICAGLSCLDLQLIGCTQSGSDEAIERYDEAVHCAGGSASMTGTTLALLLRSPDNEEEQKAEEVHILTKIGPDFAGNTLLEFYRRAGASTSLVLTDEAARTSMAVLPVFQNGKRGCFVNLACNDGFKVDELLGQVDDGVQSTIANPTRAFLFGYPHLMPKMQGDSLRSMLQKARQKLGGNCVLVGVDLNGVDGSDPSAAREVLLPALSEIDVLHLNEDEAMVLSSSSSQSASENIDTTTTNDVSPHLLSQIAMFHQQGCAVVLLSLGSKGALVSVTPDAQRLQKLSPASPELPSVAISQWKLGTQVRIPAFQILHGEVNTNGAGDGLFSGFCLAASSWGCVMEKQLCEGDECLKVTPQVAGTFASLVAWQRCDARTRDGDGMRSAAKLMEMIRRGNLPDALAE